MIKIETETVGDVSVITLSGDLDSRGNQALDKTLRTLSGSGCFKIIIDLSTIRFVGSQTMSILVSNLKEIRAGGGDIKFLNPQRSVVQYLKQNRVFEIFQIYSTKSDAVLSYSSEPGTRQPSSPAEPARVAQSSEKGNPVEEPASKTSVERVGQNLQTSEILYANSCILATLIKTLEHKGVLSAREAGELLEYELK